MEVLVIILGIAIGGILQIGPAAIIRYMIMKRPCKRKLTAVALTASVALAFYTFTWILYDGQDVVFGVPDFVMALINYHFLFKPGAGIKAEQPNPEPKPLPALDSDIEVALKNWSSMSDGGNKTLYDQYIVADEEERQKLIEKAKVLAGK